MTKTLIAAPPLVLTHAHFDQCVELLDEENMHSQSFSSHSPIALSLFGRPQPFKDFISEAMAYLPIFWQNSKYKGNNLITETKRLLNDTIIWCCLWLVCYCIPNVPCSAVCGAEQNLCADFVCCFPTSWRRRTKKSIMSVKAGLSCQSVFVYSCSPPLARIKRLSAL